MGGSQPLGRPIGSMMTQTIPNPNSRTTKPSSSNHAARCSAKGTAGRRAGRAAPSLRGRAARPGWSCEGLTIVAESGERADSYRSWRESCFLTEFQGRFEGTLSLGPDDKGMTLLIVSIPLMVLAVAVAVLPVLLMSIREARRGQEGTSAPSTSRVAAQPVDAHSFAGAGEDVYRAAA